MYPLAVYYDLNSQYLFDFKQCILMDTSIEVNTTEELTSTAGQIMQISHDQFGDLKSRDYFCATSV